MARKRLTGNKQRLVELTERERRAAIRGGVIDDSIPMEAWRARLRDEPGHHFEVERLADTTWSEIGCARGFHNPGQAGPIVPDRLEPGELRAQASATIDFIDALILRLDNLHPILDGLADAALYPAHGEDAWQIIQRLKPDLFRLRAGINAARGEIPEGKPGPKQGLWHEARDRLAEALRVHSTPPVAASKARSLAADLLALCGLPNPRER